MRAEDAAADQGRLLEEAFGFVAEQRFYLRKAVQKNDLEMTLRYAFCLANELRTSHLPPINYYKLYALVFWELQHVAAFIASVDRHGLGLQEIYELVQFEGNVLPRLYLLITVGAVYIQASECHASEILEDLCKMLDAVQHPVRGLFLRYYMLQMTKDKLIQVCGARGALKILLANLRESTSLWVRLRLDDSSEHDEISRRAVLDQVPLQDSTALSGSTASSGGLGGSPIGDQDASAKVNEQVPQPLQPEPSQEQPAGPKDEQNPDAKGDGLSLGRNRHMLQMLIGAHMMHMARMRLLTTDLHAELVLPEILRLGPIEDPVGQAYLLECFVEVFPDSYHMHTLDQVLTACAQLQWVVDLKQLLQNLMQRLTTCARSAQASADANVPGRQSSRGDVGVPGKICIYDAFYNYLKQLHSRPRSVATPLSSLLELLLELLMMAIMLHPGDAGRIERVLHMAAELVAVRQCQLDVESVQAIVNIVAAPLTSASIASAVLATQHHQTLVGALSRLEWRHASLAMAKAILAGDVPLTDAETLQRLLELLDPLIHDDSWGASFTSPRGKPDDASEGAVAQNGCVKPPKVAPAAAVNSGDSLCVHDGAAFTAEQEVMAQLVHQTRHTDAGISFAMLKVMRRFFDQGGPHRVIYTLPACLVATLRLVKPVVVELEHNSGEDIGITVHDLFSFTRSLLEDGLRVLRAEERLRLWLLCASCAARAQRSSPGSIDHGLSQACEHALQGGLACFEGDANHMQLSSLQMLVGTLEQITCLPDSVYEDLADRVAKLGLQLPTRSLQSRALATCVHLHWGTRRRDAWRAVNCLHVALKLGDGALHADPTDIGLFVEVLDQAVFLFESDNAVVTPAFLSGLLALCVQHCRYLAGRVPPEVKRALATTLLQLKARAPDDRYTKIKLVSPPDWDLEAAAAAI